MCLIIHKPAGKTVPREIISSALENNRDGFGIMASNGKVLRAIGVTEAQCAQAIASVNDYDAAIHWRMATQGTVTKDNAHPFRVHNHLLMHNGHIGGFTDKRGLQSDTKLFAERWLAPRVAGKKIITNSSIEKAIGVSNAAILMRPDKSMDIINRQRGTDYLGLWFSNLYAWDAPYELVAERSPVYATPKKSRGHWYDTAFSFGNDSLEVARELSDYNAGQRDKQNEDARDELVLAVADRIPLTFNASDAHELEPARGAPASDFVLWRQFTAGKIDVMDYLDNLSARSLVGILLYIR